MPIVLVASISTAEPNPLFPEDLEDVRTITQAAVVAPRTRQANARDAEMLAEEIVGLADLLADPLKADAPLHADRFPIVDIDRFEQLMGVGVLLQVKERI